MQFKSSSTDLSVNRAHRIDCMPTRRQKRAIRKSETSAETEPISNSRRVVNMMKMNQPDCVLSNCQWRQLIVLIISLTLTPLSTLAFNFNYQPELTQTNQHQLSLSPQALNGLNQNTFYQPPANQFVPGQQFFSNHQAFAQTVQLKPQQQIGGSGGGSLILNPPPSAPNVDVSGIAGQLGEPQRDSTNSYSLDAPSETSVFTETNRAQSMGNEVAASSTAPQATLTGTRRPGEQLATSQSSTTMSKRQLTPVERQEAAADHEVVRSAPPPPGKILDVVRRDSSVVSAVSPAVPIVREQLSPSATTTSTTTTSSTTTTTSAPRSATPANQQRHVLKPARHNGAAFSNKDQLKRAEQQIIEQHVRDVHSNGQVNRQRLEQTTTAPQYLLPNSYRDSGNKFVGSLFSTLLNYNSQTTSVSGGQDGGDSSLLKLSSSSQAPVADRQKTDDGEGLLSSLTSNFRSGISSRTSVVKAAMGDNKLARTITSLGKTIGGNKYVAGAGIAAALAALGLTVGKLMSPYVMMGSNYEKLGGPGSDQLTSGSVVQPTYYDQATGRPYFYPSGDLTLPLGGQNQYATDSLVAAANTIASYESGAYDPNLLSQQASNFPANNWQQQQIANIRPMQPAFSQTTISPIVESANGHYSSYYSNQLNSEQFTPSGATYQQPSQLMTAINTNYNYDQLPHQFLQPRYGSYVSGAPSQSIPDVGRQHFYSDQDRSQQMPSVYFDSSPASSPNGDVGSIQFNADQITASASSDTPTFPDQTQLMSALAISDQHRSGTMSLTLSEKERNLLKQQIELLKRSRQQSNRFVVAAGGDQSTKSPTVGQQHFITSTSLPKAHLDPVGGRGEWSGLHVNDSTSSWNTNSVASTGTGLAFGNQAKKMKQQQQFVIKYPPVQTMSSENLSSQPIRVVSSPQMQKGRGEATRAPAYLLIASNSNQTQWQASAPASALVKRPRQWSQTTRVPQVAVDTVAIEPVTSAPASQFSGWQSLDATRQHVATAANAPETAKKSLPQEASEFGFEPIAVATDDEGELDDETQSVTENNNNNKPKAVAGDKTTRLRRITRFDPLDSGLSGNLSAEAFSIPLEDFFSRHLKGSESSSASSGETKSGQPSGRPQEKSDAKGNDVEIGHSGGKYQIDADGNGGNSFESAIATTTATTSGSAADQPRDKANKLIESTVANNAAVSVSLARPIVTGVGSASTTQHDHQHHNHKPQPDSNGDQLGQTDNDNVVVELLPAATGERRADYEDNDSNGGAGKQRDTPPVGGHRVVGQLDEVATTNDKRRSFRGLVAGSIGAS